MRRNVPQVRKLNYDGEDIGMGFNSDTGLAIGTCLDFTPPTGDLSQEAEADVSIITSHEDLMSKLHMAAELEGHYAFSSASGKVDYATSTQYNSSSTFVVARMVLANTVSRGRNFKLKPEFQHLLDTDQPSFNRAFGDSFVRAQFKGGEFYAVMRVTSVDSKTQSNLSVSLQADVQGGLAGGSFKGDLETANQSDKTRSEFTAKFYQKGGAGGEKSEPHSTLPSELRSSFRPSMRRLHHRRRFKAIREFSGNATFRRTASLPAGNTGRSPPPVFR
jgi:hypothetical protein